METAGETFEIVLVVTGSSDHTSAMLARLPPSIAASLWSTPPQLRPNRRTGRPVSITARGDYIIAMGWRFLQPRSRRHSSFLEKIPLVMTSSALRKVRIDNFWMRPHSLASNG